MKLYGGINLNEDGISLSLRDMHLQTEMIGTINQNVNGFNKAGYQRQAPVLSSFAELIGAHAYSTVVDQQVGRVSYTERPLDFALNKEGYFQYQSKDGVKLTRDGRFKLDKDGYMLTLEDNRVLSSSGRPIKFDKIPKDLNDIKVEKDGNISFFDKDSLKKVNVGQFSVVSNEGSILRDVDVRQKYVEYSNVSLQNEFMNLIPIRRNFEANRQLYILQNDQLSKTIQDLGRAN